MGSETSPVVAGNPGGTGLAVMTGMTKTNAKQIADATIDAYSRNRFSDAGWLGIIRALLAAGATEAEARWVLESKHTRWAADAASRNQGATAANFLAYANSPHVGNVEKLVLAARFELAKDAQ